MQGGKATARIVGVLFIIGTASAVAGDRLVRPIRDEAEIEGLAVGHIGARITCGKWPLPWG